MFVNRPSIYNFFSHSIVFHTVFYNGLRKGEGGTKGHDCVLIACNDLIRIKVFESPGILIQKQVILRTESEDIPVCGVSVFNIRLFDVNDKIVFSFPDELSVGISPIIFSYKVKHRNNLCSTCTALCQPEFHTSSVLPFQLNRSTPPS